MLNQWHPYLIAIVLGLLVGIEREKAHPRQGALGVRTFLLISILGAVAGGLQNTWLAILLSVFSLSLILLSYISQINEKKRHPDRGLTTEFAAGIIFCLAYTTHLSPALSALVGPIVALILFSKRSLHRFTHAIQPSELETALLLFLGGVVVVNIVPDSVIDPWGIFHPRKFGYLVLTLATLEFSSYVLAKFIGERKGAVVSGFLGGFVSSTAILVSSLRQIQQKPDSWQPLLSSTMAAKIASLLEAMLIIALISPKLLLNVGIPVALMILINSIALFALAKLPKRDKSTGSNFSLQSPLDWLGVLRLSVLLSAILGAVSVAKLWIGDNASYTISFLTGLFELHGVTLANVTMFSQNQLSTTVASISILLAISASLFSQITISLMFTRSIFSRTLSLIFFPMILISASAIYFLYNS